MDFVEDIRVSEERAEAGVGAKVDRPAAIFDAREICRISIAEDAPAESDKAWIFLLFASISRHTLVFPFNLCNENFKGIDG